MAKTNIFKEHKEITSLCEAIHAKPMYNSHFYHQIIIKYAWTIH